jgi:hypothetical protein
MQILRANNLHVEKENREKDFRKHQEEGGNKNIINVGDQANCPECKRTGRVVWVSKDGKTAGIQCPASHRMTNRPVSRFGTLERPQSKASRNMVFMMEIK